MINITLDDTVLDVLLNAAAAAQQYSPSTPVGNAIKRAQIAKLEAWQRELSADGSDLDQDAMPCVFHGKRAE